MSARALRRSMARLRDLGLSALYVTGLLWILARARLRNRAVVLTYHRVLPADRQQKSFSSPGILVTPETFDWQLGFLRRHLKPLHPDEFVRILHAGGRFPSLSCLVTFDDGWHDTLEFALPILRRHGMPALLFVPTDHVGQRRGFWQERLTRQLFTHRADPRALALIASRCGLTGLDGASLADRETVHGIVVRLKSRPPAEVEGLLGELERLQGAPQDFGEDRFLDWEEIGRVAASGLVTIGSHARSHRPLVKLPIAEVRQELRDSIETLRERTGAAPTLFSYPNGNASVETAGAAEDAGFAAAFVTGRGHIGADSHRFLLPRINIHESASGSPGTFLGRLLGFT